MTTTPLITAIEPAAKSKRIEVIDIIRGFALLGILIINFTVDDEGLGPMDGWTGIGDQAAYWFIRFFMDDRFQTIFCFLFGLGFAIQMQKRADGNSSFALIFFRRMLALYMIGLVPALLFMGAAFYVLPHYAMIGVLLFLFRKMPVKWLPLFALLMFMIPWSKQTYESIKKDHLVKKPKSIESSFLDNCAGVYLTNINYLTAPETYFVIERNRDTLYIESVYGKKRLYKESENNFFVETGIERYSFIQEKTEKVSSIILHAWGNFTATRVEMDSSGARKKIADQKVALKAAREKKLSYPRFIKNNAEWLYNTIIKYWSWKRFLWGGYAIVYIFVLFLLGLYAGKRKVFSDIQGNRYFFRQVMCWGLIVGAVCIASVIGIDLWKYITGDKGNQFDGVIISQLISLIWGFGIMLMAFGYIAALTLLTEKEKWKKRFSFLIPVGQMALTCFILHFAAYVFIFNKFEWCLALGGKTGGLYRLLLAIGVFVLLYFFCRLWLKYFKTGPFEWIWRSFTYWQWQPMRKNEIADLNTATVINH